MKWIVRPIRRQRIGLLIVGGYLWVMMILLGSIMLETFMVYPNIFYNPPDSFKAGLEFMRRFSSTTAASSFSKSRSEDSAHETTPISVCRR
jgi:hypothetical protein